MASTIDTITKRRKLKARKEPYWHKVTTGQYVGYRKTKEGGTWHARLRIPGDTKQIYEPLRKIPDDAEAFEAALKAAQEWFSRAAAVTDHRYAVERCVEDYVSHLRVENGEDSATRVQQRLARHLTPQLGKVEMTKLTTAQVKRWRDGMVRISEDEDDTRRSKDSANRVLSIAKAAFNLAFRSGLVGSDQAWRRVSPFKDVGENRKLFLTDAQVGRLLGATNGGFRDLVEAAVLTGDVTANLWRRVPAIWTRPMEPCTWTVRPAHATATCPTMPWRSSRTWPEPNYPMPTC